MSEHADANGGGSHTGPQQAGSHQTSHQTRSRSVEASVASDAGTDTGAREAPGIWRGHRRRLTIGILSLVLLIAFEAMAVGTAMPVAVRSLEGLPYYAWTFSGFMAASMLGTIVAGELSDRAGPFRPLVLGVLLFTLGLATTGSAPNMLIFVVGRVLQGLGAGGAFVPVMVVIARAYPSELRPKAFGAVSAAWVVPAIVGPAVAGLVAEHVSWRLVFLGLLPLVVLPVVLIFPRVRALGDAEPAGERRPGRATLALAAAVGVGLVQYAGQRLTWWSLAFLAAGLVLLVPSLPKLLPPGTLRFARGLPSVVRIRGILGGTFGGAGAYVPLMLVEQHRISPALAGIALTVGSLGWSTGAFVQARHWVGLSRPQLIRLGAVAVTAGTAGMILVAWPGVPWWFAPIFWTVSGLGMGLAMASLSVLLYDYSPREQQGANSAAMQLAESVGNLTMVGLGGIIFAALWETVSGTLTFGSIFAPMAIFVAIAALTAGRLRA